METPRDVLASLTRSGRVMLMLFLLPASASAQAVAWRPLALGEASTERLGGELGRALAGHFQLAPGALAVELVSPRLVTDGSRFRLLAPQGRVRMRDADAWGLAVNGEVGFADLAVDYPSLVAGELAMSGRPRIWPAIRVDQDSLEAYMRAKGVLDASFGVATTGAALELAGAYRLRFLFFHLRPEVRVRGRLEVHGARAGFLVDDVEVRRVPGVVRRLLLAAVERMAARGVFTELDLSGVRLAGGALEVVNSRGQTLYRQPLGAGQVASE